MADKRENKAGEDAAMLKTVGKIKGGNYMIHLFVQQARNLQIDNVDTVDPIVQVQ